MIMVVGDIHADFSELNKLINKKQNKGLKMILQCGDFGYWPKCHNTTAIGRPRYGNTLKVKKWNFFSIKTHGVEVYFCDGNHEDHDSLDELNDDKTTLLQNVYFQKRGSYLTLPDGRNVLFMGGADSTDKDRRTPGYDWFPQETISQKDIYNLPDIKVDIVISHTCPIEFDIIRDNDPLEPASRKALSYVLKKYNPSLWYFGHFHKFKPGKFGTTKWTALSHCWSGNRWWTELEK